MLAGGGVRGEGGVWVVLSAGIGEFESHRSWDCLSVRCFEYSYGLYQGFFALVIVSWCVVLSTAMSCTWGFFLLLGFFLVALF